MTDRQTKQVSALLVIGMLLALIGLCLLTGCSLPCHGASVWGPPNCKPPGYRDEDYEPASVTPIPPPPDPSPIPNRKPTPYPQPTPHPVYVPLKVFGDDDMSLRVWGTIFK